MHSKFSAPMIGMLVLFLQMSPAFADELIGAWLFESSEGNGVMLITEKQGILYHCEFSIANSKNSATQICKGVRTGNKFTIKSEVVKSFNRWHADNFSLIIDGSKMTGDVISTKKGTAVFTKQ